MITAQHWARFWGNVDKRPNGCWLWESSLGVKGYGVFSIGPQRFRAHRFSYEAIVGPIPNGLTLDHLCRVRNCVNPAHLEAVSSGENAIRGMGPPATNSRKTHCVRGHDLKPENLLKNNRGWRECVLCNRLTQQAIRANRRRSRV